MRGKRKSEFAITTGGAQLSALIADTALAKVQENVRCLESHNQRSSIDLADRLAAVIADRDKMLSSAKDKSSRLTKERDFYKTELEALQNLINSECEESANDKVIFNRIAAEAKSARKDVLDLRQQLDTESAAARKVIQVDPGQ